MPINKTIELKKSDYYFFFFSFFLLLIQIIFFGFTFGTFSLFAFLTYLTLLKFLYKLRKNKHFNFIWKLSCLFNFLFILSFIIIQTLIISSFNSNIENPSSYDFAVVLGAALDGDQPSNRLKIRLDEAFLLLRDVNIPIILSGGQGPDEEITEAMAMKLYLEEKGIDESRLFLEQKSVSTQTNLIYSNQIRSSFNSTENPKVILITSDYHLFRAKMIASRLGWQVEGKAAQNPWSLRVNYLLREYLALIKDLIIIEKA